MKTLSRARPRPSIESYTPRASSGWEGFYWGKTVADHARAEPSINGALTRAWLEVFRALRVVVRLSGEHLRQPLHRLLLQLAHLHRVHLVPRRDRVLRLDALEGLKTYPGFQIGTVLTSFLGNGDCGSDSGLMIRPVQLSGTTSDNASLWPHGSGN